MLYAMSERIKHARRSVTRVRRGKEEEFLAVMKEKVMPQLMKAKGIRRAYLLRTEEIPGEFISLSFWNSKGEADEYERTTAEGQGIAAGAVEGPPSVVEFVVEQHLINPDLPAPEASEGQFEKESG